MYDMMQPEPGTLSRDPVFTALLAQLPAGVVIAARDGHFEVVNDVARDIFAQHRHAPGIDAAAALEPIHWIVARVLLTGEIVRGEEIQFIDTRDEWRTLNVCATPLGDVRGDITRALVTFIDVTTTNRAREWEPLIRAITKL